MINSKAVRKKCPNARSEASGPAKQFYTKTAFERNIARGAHRSIISWQLRLNVNRRALPNIPFDSSAILLSLSFVFSLRMVLVASRHATYVFTRTLLVFVLAQIEIETNRLSTWCLVMRPMKLLWHGLTLAFTSSFALGTRITARLAGWLSGLCIGWVCFLIIISLATQGHR